ncbi:uncharacterized protein LAESUDRAFT_748343 [Laetiporus sulphureus 93-53]|uniref:Uncharacterized protein n=1 Tax=Laetiporus sulphureus 93-53 TaxID=1314785 RepID=A0A165FKQ3_9APHY|nr:uncharacterized protein LAESUDRAFT_748343 [Laetiporus sulphureus 93-53]KZT09118.1 hypothetical protein LAESUDRAFT_748343 [Laetiporus sulphureus 93-53]
MSLRQRVPFQSSAENEQQGEEHILDDQEQQELIEGLRRQSDAATSQYLFLVQAVIGLSLLLHIVFILSGDNPFYALLPWFEPLPPAIPLSPFFAFLHILLHLNLFLLLLPPAHPLILAIAGLPFPLSLITLPLAFTFVGPFTLGAPALSLLFLAGWPEVFWWSVLAGLTWFVYSVKNWNEQSDVEIRELEGLSETWKSYDIRGRGVSVLIVHDPAYKLNIEKQIAQVIFLPPTVLQGMLEHAAADIHL